MKKVAAVLVAAVLLVGCGKSAADTPECKAWQARYEGAGAYDTMDGSPAPVGAMLRSELLKTRPDGCPIP